MKRSQTSSLGKAPSGKFLALSGGVGGAKLALGLHRLLAPPQLTVVVNTGDDFEHLGLHIAQADLDTVMYVLAGVCSGERGWGRSGDSWTFMEAISELGEEDWFRLGDKDLATHVLRTCRLRGDSLSSVTADLCRRFGLNGPIIPMSDEAVRTMVQTDLGELPFQEYFVKQKCRPQVRGFRFDGADRAQPNPALLECCRDPELAAVIICPSNPFVSADPLLSIPGAREAIAGAAAPKIAVSPIVAGQAVKGPLAKMMSELGLAPSCLSVAMHYEGLIDAIVIDNSDAEKVADLESAGFATHVTNTVMESLSDRIQLARSVLALARRLAGLS